MFMNKNELRKLKEYRDDLAQEVQQYDTDAIEEVKTNKIIGMALGSYAGLLRKQLDKLDKLFPQLKEE